MPIALPTREELRRIEAAASAELPAGVLMQRAGEASAAIAWRECLAGRIRPTAAVLAGPGGNGGDAFIAALALMRRGVHVSVYASADSKSFDAREARARCAARAEIYPLNAFQTASTPDSIIDGILGIGVDRYVTAEVAAVIEHANMLRSRGAWTLALDVPTGLNAFSGITRSARATICADHTVTFICMKPGLFTGNGPDFCGQISLESLEIDVPVGGDALIEALDFMDALPARRPSQHKGSSGDLVVIGGAAGMVGAALLAGRAAAATGIGRLYVCLEGDRFSVDPLYPEIMIRTWETAPPAQSATVIGCGLSQSARAANILASALESASPVLVDADALNLIAANDGLAQQLRGRSAPTVLTPHLLEAARLLRSPSETIQSDRLAAARQIAAVFNAYVVLKGAGSIVATPDGRCRVNPTGGAALATGGTGDMLAGCIGALLAVGTAPFEAACAGVYAHGAAAQQFSSTVRGDAGLHSQEFLPLLRTAMNRLRGASA
jgi:hydroxyethylthiazole kinase-like uncharacterized protein yjeF